jgi:hypothetical protein
VQNIALHAHGYVNIAVSRKHGKSVSPSYQLDEKVSLGVRFSMKSRLETNM